MESQGQAPTPETASTEEDQAQVRIAYLASCIRDEKQLRQVLETATLGLRRGVYEQIVPHLSFKPRAYPKLMRHA